MGVPTFEGGRFYGMKLLERVISSSLEATIPWRGTTGCLNVPLTSAHAWPCGNFQSDP